MLSRVLTTKCFQSPSASHRRFHPLGCGTGLTGRPWPCLTNVHRSSSSRYHFASEAPAVWGRVFFAGDRDRKAAIRRLDAAGHGPRLANDDGGPYVRVAARLFRLALADWAVLRGYVHARGGAHPAGASSPAAGAASPGAEHYFRVPMGGYLIFDDPMAPAAAQQLRTDVRRDRPALRAPRPGP